MPSFLIVTGIIAVDDHLSMINRIEHITIDHFPLQVGVQRLDVGIILGRGHMGELLVDTLVFEVLPHRLGNEL